MSLPYSAGGVITLAPPGGLRPRGAATPRAVSSASVAAAGDGHDAPPLSLVRGIREGLRLGHVTCVGTAALYMDRVEASQRGGVHAFVHAEGRDEVLRVAGELDGALERARAEGQGAVDHLLRERPLFGVPLAVKDNLCTRGMATTAGSRILEGFVPPTDATAVERLRRAGCVIIGKTNMDEFGMGSTGENSAFFATTNPWDKRRVPGGSSSGSAAAVAAGACAAALGSDTGGSIRQPAAFCGVVGLKPTYGRVSRSGLVAYASSLDCVGPMGVSVPDVAELLDAMVGSEPGDPLDSTCSAAPYAPVAPEVDKLVGPGGLRGLRVGMVSEAMSPDGCGIEVLGAVRGAVDTLRALGADVVDVSLPTLRSMLPAYYVLAPSEASANLARFDGVRYGMRNVEGPAGDSLKAMYGATRRVGFGAEVRRRILVGTYALSAGYYDAYYKKAQQVRTLVQREFQSAYENCDVLLLPSTTGPAFALGEVKDDPLAAMQSDLMTIAANAAGVPAISVPCGISEREGLPLGLQLMAPAFGEGLLLQVARAYEVGRDWHPALPRHI